MLAAAIAIQTCLSRTDQSPSAVYNNVAFDVCRALIKRYSKITIIEPGRDGMGKLPIDARERLFLLQLDLQCVDLEQWRIRRLARKTKSL